MITALQGEHRDLPNYAGYLGYAYARLSQRAEAELLGTSRKTEPAPRGDEVPHLFGAALRGPLRF
jgi:hypothetical protein